jgi:hypothetical protein
MPKRLTELFPIGSFVEIKTVLGWLPGQVVQHTPPAVWVRLVDGRYLFVTNGRKIRPLNQEKEDNVHDID